MIHGLPTEWIIPRESKEWIGPITVLVNGVASSSFQIALLLDGTRPVVSDWGSPVEDQPGQYGVIADTLTPGRYRIWVRYTTALEDVVIDDIGFVIST